MINRILVPIRDDGNAELVLRHAINLAQGMSAHIVVTHCRLRPVDMLPFGVPMSREMKQQIMEQSTAVMNLTESSMRELFTAICKDTGVIVSDDTKAAKLTAKFVEAEGRQVDVVRRYGMLSDIIVVAKPEIDRNLGANTLKTALFHTGRPVFMCGADVPDSTNYFNQKVALCWDGSLESTRALSQTLWFIKSAKHLTILTVENGKVEIEPAELKIYLGEHDIMADIVMVKPSKSVGASLMEVSENLEADVTILGAYGNNQYFERVLGGVTQHFVDHASRPLVLVH
jgi:nucleotide-binding universal stress UspA family protein